MVAWQVPEDDSGRAGVALAAAKGVTLCYQRRPDQRHWPFNRYCMIHAQSRDEARTTLRRAAAVDSPSPVAGRVRCVAGVG